tara:strand:+ start:167 stop:307 length:141 start_codon:yes stop_codon:yes gene_type:complete
MTLTMSRRRETAELRQVTAGMKADSRVAAPVLAPVLALALVLAAST